METARNVSLGQRVAAVLIRDPLTAPHARRNDALLAAGLGVVAVVIALVGGDGRRPDVLGWALLFAVVLPLVWRRRAPLLVLLTMVAFVAPYHALDYNHNAPIPATMTALYTVGATGRPRRTLLTGAMVVGVTTAIAGTSSPHDALEVLRISGWIVAFLMVGMDVRIYRRYADSLVERAERAERTREEEAARRVAEERVRIARDLHDLLAHSITLIGVRTSVASHILTVTPDRLDRAAVAQALEEIAETCRDARAEVRTTLEVLREGTGEGTGPAERRPAAGAAGEGPLPDLASLPGLVRRAGARLTLRTDEAPYVPPAVAAAAYRIVQEALTNSVRHAGPGAAAAVRVEASDAVLRVVVTDDGDPSSGGGGGGTPGSGFGIVGMRERARSVGGTLSAEPREEGGFEVAAILPLRARAAQAVRPVQEPYAAQEPDGAPGAVI
ncbi:sensor histidine kinase [Streptomyces sp. NPDC087420]|uniref:sensor histidine kinase n=1 Tax=Streptomyces sp. NPDC087420 TaxID=3365785 RepID=UPI00383632E9